MKAPRFKSGDVGKLTERGRYNPAFFETMYEPNTVHRVVCVSDVYVTESGVIVNDWLLPSGELKTIPAENVAKR